MPVPACADPESTVPADRARTWREAGYVVVRGVFDAERVARLLPIFEHVRAEYLRRDPLTGRPGAEVADFAMSQPHHPGFFGDRPEWRRELLEAGADPRVLDAARAALGEEPYFRSLGYWFNPAAGIREGDWHRDSQFYHHDPEDERANLHRFRGAAAQFQIALVPSEDLELVPGSHLRWDTDEELRIRRGDGGRHATSGGMPGAVRIRLQAGDGVLFDPSGHHRGRYHADKPRRTFMVTLTTHDGRTSDRFSHQPWFLDAGHLDGLSPAARAFYQRFIDTYGGWWRGGEPVGMTGTPS